jgi:K+-sensing histidine kinase KdpD
VRDSGPGLTPESIDRLFDAFYTTKADGMGMGLSICHSIVEAHEGRIWAPRDFGQAQPFSSPCRFPAREVNALMFMRSTWRTA